jgi:hypothetical protein
MGSGIGTDEMFDDGGFSRRRMGQRRDALMTNQVRSPKEGRGSLTRGWKGLLTYKSLVIGLIALAWGISSLTLAMPASLAGATQVTGSQARLTDVTSEGLNSARTCPSVGNHVIGMARTEDGQGYWLGRSGGRVESFGDAPVIAPQPLPSAPIVSIAAVPGTTGYLLLGQNGTVVAEGATSFGSAPLGSACTAVSIAVTQDGRGYWVLLSNGGIFSFGDARYYGSPAGGSQTHFVDLTPTPDGQGYWILGSDGLIDPFGDAVGWCNLAQIIPNDLTVAGLASTPDGTGFWVIGTTPESNGGVFACGSAVFEGAPHPAPRQPFVAVASTPNGMGYWLLDDHGRVFPYGNALTYPEVGTN